MPSPTVSRTKDAPGLIAYREEGHPIPRLLTLGEYDQDQKPTCHHHHLQRCNDIHQILIKGHLSPSGKGSQGPQSGTSLFVAFTKEPRPNKLNSS